MRGRLPNSSLQQTPPSRSLSSILVSFQPRQQDRQKKPKSGYSRSKTRTVSSGSQMCGMFVQSAISTLRLMGSTNVVGTLTLSFKVLSPC